MKVPSVTPPNGLPSGSSNACVNPSRLYVPPETVKNQTLSNSVATPLMVIAPLAMVSPPIPTQESPGHTPSVCRKIVSVGPRLGSAGAHLGCAQPQQNHRETVLHRHERSLRRNRPLLHRNQSHDCSARHREGTPYACPQATRVHFVKSNTRLRSLKESLRRPTVGEAPDSAKTPPRKRTNFPSPTSQE